MNPFPLSGRLLSRLLSPALLLLSLLSGADGATSQILSPFTDGAGEFRARVKSVGEFVDRFNGVSELGGVSRRELLMSLFDASNPLNERGDTAFYSAVLDFIGRIDSSGLLLSLPSPEVGAKVACTVSLTSSPDPSLSSVYRRPVVLSLRAEPRGGAPGGEWGWALTGVEGLVPSDFGGSADAALLNPFSPDNHFSNLSSDLMEARGIPGAYRSAACPPDVLTLLLVALADGSASMGPVGDVWLEFLSVPGFLFTVREYDRRGSNSGWLISSLSRI